MDELAKFGLYVALGAAGAASVEILKLWEFSRRLEHKDFNRRLQSPKYWVLATLFLLASGFVAWVVADVEMLGTVKRGSVAIYGAGANALLRSLLGAATAAPPPGKLGNDIRFRDLFH